MATVTVDLMDNANRTELTEDGYQVDRVLLVTGITKTANDSVVYDAITDAGVPDLGDNHPTISDCPLKKITGTALSPTKARLVLTYFRDDTESTSKADAIAVVTSTTTTEEQKTDKNGDEMETSYVVTVTPFAWTTYDERFTAQIEKPRTRFEFTYKSATHPISDIKTYMGKINSVIWNTFPVKTILCSEINAEPEGDDFQVTFVFLYNPDTWVFNALVSQPPGNLASSTDTDLDLDTGIKEFDVYGEVSFAPLGFVFDT